MSVIDVKLIEAAMRPAMPGEKPLKQVRQARRGIAQHYRELREAGQDEASAIIEARQHWLECYLSFVDCEASEEFKP